MINYTYVPDTPDFDSNKQAKKRTYVCKNCHTVIVASSQPSTVGCPTSKRVHSWGSFAQIGTRPKMYVCRCCGLRINSSLHPMNGSPTHCENGKNHTFM